MKINTINKICNLEKNIELLKKNILEVQIKKIGELNYENLKKIDFINIDFSDNEKEKNTSRIKKITLMDLLKIKEEEYDKQLKLNTNNDHENNKLKEKYNIEKQKLKMKKDYTDKLNILTKSFEEEKNKLEENLSNIKQEREHKLNTIQLYDDKIVLLLDKITHYTEHNNSIRKNIRQENKEIKALHKVCNNQIRKYQLEHNAKYKLLCGGNKENEEEKCKNELKKLNKEKLNCKLLFVEKYNNYLTLFYQICNYYGENETGIVKNCIIFTREQVQNKIDELIKNTEELKKNYYEKMDEEYLKTDYESEIEKLDNDYKLKIKEKKKYIKDTLDSIKNLIEEYKKRDKLKSREEIMEYIDNLKKKKLELEYLNQDLEVKYKTLITIKMGIKPNCLEKLNILKADSLKKIYLKKKECAKI